MGTRGYRVERQMRTTDTNGVPIEVATGVVPDQRGRLDLGRAEGDRR